MSDQAITNPEEWRPVKGFDGYFVSNFGRVLSHPKSNRNSEHILDYGPDSRGYVKITLRKNGKRYYPHVHRLVMIAFVPPDPERPHVNHKDGVKTNNHLSNLEWCTCSENRFHAFRVLGYKMKVGDAHHSAKITNKDVECIWEMRRAGARISELEQMFNSTSIQDILRGRIWSSVTSKLLPLPKFQHSITISEEQVWCMRAMFSSGMRIGEISRFFSIGHPTVSRIAHQVRRPDRKQVEAQ